ncbi:hypothetical protein V8E54_008954 [Elaphomyces granulatus]
MDVVIPYHCRVHADIIDRLDDVSGLQYHHEGPYDVACAEKNQSDQSSPVAALSHSNTEILKATPPYKINDSLHCHRPLDGVAFYPPGATDPEGNTYDYSEGSDMHMTDRDMNFMWIPGIKFTDADFANDPFYSGDRVGLLRGIGSLLNRLRKAAA